MCGTQGDNTLKCLISGTTDSNPIQPSTVQGKAWGADPFALHCGFGLLGPNLHCGFALLGSNLHCGFALLGSNLHCGYIATPILNPFFKHRF